MQFRVLGALEVLVDGEPISLGRQKQRTVLARLLLHPNQVVPAEDLIDEVWGEEPPDTARKTLQGYVTHLRRALGADRLQWRTPGYVLRLGPREPDAVTSSRSSAKPGPPTGARTGRRSFIGGLWSSGEGPRSRTSPVMGRSPPRLTASRNFVSMRWKRGSRPTSTRADATSWCPSSRR
jgi:hypothetical protein